MPSQHTIKRPNVKLPSLLQLPPHSVPTLNRRNVRLYEGRPPLIPFPNHSNHTGISHPNSFPLPTASQTIAISNKIGKSSLRIWSPHQQSCQNCTWFPKPASNWMYLLKPSQHIQMLLQRPQAWGHLFNLEIHPPHNHGINEEAGWCLWMMTKKCCN